MAFIWNKQKRQIYKDRKTIVVGWGQEWGLTENGHEAAY